VARPRLLLMPTVTEVEWRIRPLLEDWAEVASFDAPGIGEEPGTEFTVEAIVERGLAELDALGWDRFVPVGDEIGAAQAIRLAGRRPEAVEAIALGHPALSLRSAGDRSPLNGDVVTALVQMARTDFRSYVRALSQLTQNAYDDELADLYMERVRPETIEAYMEALFDSAAQEDLKPSLSALEVPMLLVEHRGCLMWTREGWEDFTAAFPRATTATMELKPSVNPEFASLLREFCAALPAQSESLSE
jgi:pimeloyl-ACP methyl ester carboxylesterase